MQTRDNLHETCQCVHRQPGFLPLYHEPFEFKWYEIFGDGWGYKERNGVR